MIMTVKKYRKLFQTYEKSAQMSIENIDMLVADPFVVPLPSARESRAWHEGEKWSYQNVVSLLGDRKMAKKMYKQHVLGTKK